MSASTCPRFASKLIGSFADTASTPGRGELQLKARSTPRHSTVKTASDFDLKISPTSPAVRSADVPIREPSVLDKESHARRARFAREIEPVTRERAFMN